MTEEHLRSPGTMGDLLVKRLAQRVEQIEQEMNKICQPMILVL